ncbi:uncharacterized protein BJ171DRAFT_478167 [Polychytrium aggregatum]|uniref:uncharacterized protein n=1 Tax=Polychytrium aggregatum TaxID=110093 RepID=UPI0022FE6557|nr:uncharacterized protein BJ171DRAFT_478167 [Polychytrium aggregatum]KAI9197233.1 hypothetical protein BJ171DRAFT_478167 [Polychytrium aggregatum]
MAGARVEEAHWAGTAVAIEIKEVHQRHNEQLPWARSRNYSMMQANKMTGAFEEKLPGSKPAVASKAGETKWGAFGVERKTDWMSYMSCMSCMSCTICRSHPRNRQPNSRAHGSAWEWTQAQAHGRLANRGADRASRIAHRPMQSPGDVLAQLEATPNDRLWLEKKQDKASRGAAKQPRGRPDHIIHPRGPRADLHPSLQTRNGSSACLGDGDGPLHRLPK